MKRLLTTATFLAASTTCVFAGDYPFEIHAFDCGGEPFTFIEDDSGQVSIAGAATADVTKTSKGFMVQATSQYEGHPITAMTFIEADDDYNWTGTLMRGPDVELRDCTNVTPTVETILPITEAQITDAEQTQTQRLAKMEQQRDDALIEARDIGNELVTTKTELNRWVLHVAKLNKGQEYLVSSTESRVRNELLGQVSEAACERQEAKKNLRTVCTQVRVKDVSLGALADRLCEESSQ